MTPLGESDSRRLIPAGVTRGDAARALGFEAAEMAVMAWRTYDVALDAHTGKAPGGDDGAHKAALADVFLAAVMLGRERALAEVQRGSAQ